MSWSREQVMCLIDEFKKHPCLYAVKMKEYKNKHTRTRALEAIQQSLLLMKPHVTVNDIKAKFHGLKTNFLAEHRKQLKTIHSGAANDEIYVPTIWYYNQMNFVLDHCVARAAVDAISHSSGAAIEEIPHSSMVTSGSEIIFNDEDLNNTEDIIDSQLDLQLTPASASKCSPHIGLPPPAKRRKLQSTDKALEDAADAIKQMTSAMKTRQNKPQGAPRNEYDIFGEYVSCKLQSMSPDIATEVEEKITQLLFEGIKKSKK